VDPNELLRLAQLAGFETVEEADEALVQAPMSPEAFSDAFGVRPLGAELYAGVGVGRAHTALPKEDVEELEALARRYEQIDAQVDAAYGFLERHPRASSREADLFETEQDEVFERMAQLVAKLEEGGEETQTAETSWGDEFEDGLAGGYYRATADPQYSYDPGHSSGEHLQHFIRMETGRRVSKQRALAVGREAYEARRSRVDAMRQRMVGADPGRVPEHVRVAHEIAKLKAARVPPELARALGRAPFQPNPATELHPAVSATIEALRAGMTPARALGIPLGAGLHPLLAVQVVREAQHWA